MIYRLLAVYAVICLLPGIPALSRQLPWTATWWVVGFGTAAVFTMVMLVSRAVQRRSIRRWALLYAGLTLLDIVTAPLVVAAPAGTTWQPWVWWQIGTAMVCAGVWGGLRFAAVYAGVVAVAYGLLRLTPSGGNVTVLTAVDEAIFGPVCGLVIAAVAIGMIEAAEMADDLAARLYADELQRAVDAAVSDERVRLDQLIHDDVMTTLTAAAHAQDTETTEATASLAADTLLKLDALQTGSGDGAISCRVLATLAEQTVRHVSTKVEFDDDIPESFGSYQLPAPSAEALLGGIREAVRNAVRHAHAHRIHVSMRGESVTASDIRIDFSIVDDGQGFDLGEIPGDRFGIRISLLEAVRQGGALPSISSRVGAGTTVTLTWSGRAVTRFSRTPALRVGDDNDLPAQFPVRQMVRVAWVAVVADVALGLFSLNPAMPVGPAVVTLAAVCALGVICLHSGSSLQLPGWASAVALGLVGLIALDTGVFLPPQSWVDGSLWFGFGLQLMLVTMIIRRRVGVAMVGLVLTIAGIVAWALGSAIGWIGALTEGFGQVSFVVMAVLVGRVLRSIARRQQALRRLERESIDKLARRHVAQVQRALWVADLKEQVRQPLARIAVLQDDVPADVRGEASLLEATLREAMSARNVMSEEIADLTEAARRRGVDVTFVDSSRRPPSQALLREIVTQLRSSLPRAGVSRVVVRLASTERSPKATILMTNGQQTTLTEIDQHGDAASREVGRP